MKFIPKFEIGQIVMNREIVEEFHCGIMGGMRRSLSTNILVII